MDLHFTGPYKFTKGTSYLFDCNYSKSEGIYFWTIKDKKNGLNLIHYIGETAAFAKRHREHIIQILGLNYRIIDPNLAQVGIEKIIWNGLWRDRTNNSVSNLLDNYNTLTKRVVEYVDIINVYFAPTNLPSDTRRHIEGCIASNFRNNYPELKTFYPSDNRTVVRKEMLCTEINVKADEVISGLDQKQKI